MELDRLQDRNPPFVGSDSIGCKQVGIALFTHLKMNCSNQHVCHYSLMVFPSWTYHLFNSAFLSNWIKIQVSWLHSHILITLVFLFLILCNFFRFKICSLKYLLLLHKSKIWCLNRTITIENFWVRRLLG